EHGEEEGAALNMKLNTFSYDLKYHFPKKERLELIIGIQGMSQVNTNFGEEILIPDARTNDVGVLATGIFEINDQQYLQGGLRFDNRNLSTESYTIEPHEPDENETIVPGIDRDYNNFTFSLGHRGQIFKVLTTRLNFATGFRAPNLAELSSYGVHHGSNRFEIGNPDLVSEQNFQADLSLEYVNKHIEIYANGFYNNMNNYIYSNPTGETIEEVQVFEYVQNDAELYGGEFGFHLHPHPYDWLHLESAYEMVVGKLKNGDYLPLIPANKWTNTIRGEFIGNDRFDKIYAAMVLDSYFSQDKVSEFEDPTDAYNLFHVRMGGKINFKKLNMGINISLNNLFDTSYISHLSALKSDMIPNPGRNIVLGINFDF
ncbi:MAG: TonB-dependent receptor, partial [Flavobacteriaceae bacterium]